MRWRFVLKKLLDDRVVGAVIVVAVLASVLALYEGKAVGDPGLEPGLASDAWALLAMRDSFEGDAALNWAADTPIAIWEGVRISGNPKRVTRLTLRGRFSGGSVSPRLGDLARLAQLDLRSNGLKGEIPPEIGNLADLTHIYLNDNMLTGAIPSELGGLSNLTQLYLHDNMLTGTIPSELGNLAGLTNLWLRNNRLTGTIPAELGGLPNLKRVRLSGNVLTGCIPVELAEAPNTDLGRLGLEICEGPTFVWTGRKELADLAAEDICGTLVRADLKPYEQFFLRDDGVDDDANEYMERGWSIRERAAFQLEPPIDWEHLVSVDRSWNFHLNAWLPLDSILIEHSRSSMPRHLSFALALAVDWIEQNPYPPPDVESDVEDFGWYDMAVGLRVYRLAYMLDAGCRSPFVPAEQIGQLWGALIDHFDYLADDDNIRFHNNHGLYQATGQLAAASRLSAFPVISQLRAQAVARLERMFSEHFSSEDVHLEHSPDYHRLVTNLVSGIASSGLLDDYPSLSARVERFEEVLAWMILPNLRLANLGDTDYRLLRQGDSAVTSPLLEYALSGGNRGHATSRRLGVFPESGLAVLRSGWPDALSFDQASYLAQQAGFHSRSHKQADDLSFIWYDRGSEILIDAGRYGFIGRTEVGSELWNRGFWYSDPKRIYVESTRSHNTVEIDGLSFDRKWSRPYGSAIERWGETEQGLLFVETHARQFETMSHSRLLVLNPGTWLLVYDWVRDDAGEDHDYRQWFHFAPDLDVEPRNGGLHVSGEALDKELTVVSLLPDPVSSVPVFGQEEPDLLGWWSMRGGAFEPTTSVNFSLHQSQSAVFASLFSFSDDVTPNTDYQQVDASGHNAQFQWTAEGHTHTLGFSGPAEGDLTLDYSVEPGEQ